MGALTRSDTYIPPGDWHSHTKANIFNHRKETGVLSANAQPGSPEAIIMHGHQQNRLDYSLRPQQQQQQTKGTIVRHLELHHFPAGDAPKGQGEVTNLSAGRGQALEKSRFFLTVGHLGDRVFECPIFTYGGKGLQNRDKAVWSEYCSLKPSQWRKHDFVNQSPENEVLEMVSTAKGWRMRDSMVVRLSDVRSRDVGMGGVEVLGSISVESSEYASKKAKELMSAALA